MKPRLFIASSIEARPAAERIKEIVAGNYDLEVWTEGFFQPGASTFSSISTRIKDFDGGIFILSPDDLLQSRGRSLWTPRANVLFELGMFAGVLGIGNCIQVVLKVSSKLTQSLRFSTSGEIALPPNELSELRVQIGNLVAGCYVAKTGTAQRSSRRIEPITDLAGITWIEAKAGLEEEGGRTQFLLSEQGEKAVRVAFEARAKRDALTLHALNSGGKLRTQWFLMGEPIPGDTSLIAFGDRVRAEFEWEGRTYQVSLRFEAEDRLAGEWWDSSDRGYGGSASFQVRQRPPYLLGEWIGWSTNGGVKSGPILIADEANLSRAAADRSRVRTAHELLDGDSAEKRSSSVKSRPSRAREKKERRSRAAE